MLFPRETSRLRRWCVTRFGQSCSRQRSQPAARRRWPNAVRTPAVCLSRSSPTAKPAAMLGLQHRPGDKAWSQRSIGLARAFFYLGARALLALHWRVDAATGAFLDSRNIHRSVAPRRYAALVADRSLNCNADLLVWAPSVIVGEGNQRLGRADAGRSLRRHVGQWTASYITTDLRKTAPA